MECSALGILGVTEFCSEKEMLVSVGLSGHQENAKDQILDRIFVQKFILGLYYAH